MGALSDYPKMSVPPRKRLHDSSNSQENQEPEPEPDSHTEADPEPSRKRSTPDSDVDHPEPLVSSSSSEPTTPTPAPSDDFFNALSPFDSPMQLSSEEEEQPKPLAMILPDQQFVLPHHQFPDGTVQDWTVLCQKFANATDGYLQRLSATTGDSSPTSCLTRTDFNSSPTHDDDEPFLTSPSSKLVGAGVENLGNTCFMSAVLQCFTHTVPLRQGLLSCNHNSPCDAGDFCLICAFRQHFDASLASERSIVHPQIFVDNLNYFSTSFVRYRQEDAHEFMQCALNKLKDCFPPGEDNLVEKIFGGRQISKLRCCSCGHTSDTPEAMIDLSLEIEDMCTLEDALKSFTKVEKIDDKPKCDRCKEEVSMEKRLVLDQTPLVAAFHLKRFKREGDDVFKIVNPVYFTTDIDLHPYTSAMDTDNENLRYELYAIIQHRGRSLSSGHYICFIRSAPKKWHKMDDSAVTSVSEEVVLKKEAYILFYAREGTPWFSSIVEGEQSDPKSFLDSSHEIDFGPFGLEDKENVMPTQGNGRRKQATGPPPGFEEKENTVGPPPGFGEEQNVGLVGCEEKKDAAGPSSNGHVDNGSTEAIDESVTVSDMDDECSSSQTSAPPS